MRLDSLREKYDETREQLVSRWYRWYATIIPFAVSALCIALKEIFHVDVFTSKNLSDALNGTITSVSIILSLFGVMLTLLAEAKSSSRLVKYVFDTIDVKDFVFQLKKCIMVGVLSIALSTILYFIEIEGRLFVYVFAAWLGVFCSLLCRTYRFMSLIVGMLFLKREGE